MSRGNLRNFTALLSFFLFIFLANGIIQGAIPAGERAALIALYNSTSGDSWTDNSGWKTPPLDGDGFAMPGTEGGWYGVTVTADHVTAIDLSFNNLSNSIPADIGDLTALTSLNLDGNELSGSIPTQIGNLTSLTELILSDNQLTGSIPAEIGGLTALTHINMNMNQLSGDIPTQIGNLTSLTFLDLDCNQLTGSIPAQVGSLSALTNLHLGQNQLSGSIPTEIGNLAALQTLYLTQNQLSGSIPTQIGNLSALQELILDENQLTGSIPTSLGSLSNLQNLSLRSNQLTDSIPTEIGNLTSLQQLYLYNNQLTGAIPTQIGNLTSLECVELHSNQLSGAIPTQIGNLTNLWKLHLNNNQLTGSIPTEIGNLTLLQYLFLNENQLSGSIPTQIGNLSSLKDLGLNDNQLSGTIPPELGNLANLQELNLYENELTGSIPSQLGNLTNLTWLHLGMNQLSGSIPVELGNLTNLGYLFLGPNQLTGSIPAQLGSLSNLNRIDLRENQLSGSIPVELGNITSLTELSLQTNQLTGTIPTQIGNLTNLVELGLHGNQLEGPIPTSLANLTQLVPDNTDIGYNALYSEDSGLTTFLDGKDPDWADTQTVAPTNVSAATAGATSVTLSWTPIAYTGHSGGYRVFHSETPGGPYAFIAQTADKTVTSQLVTGLSPGNTHYFVVRTRTDPNPMNDNTVDSQDSAEADAVADGPLTIGGHVSMDGTPLGGVTMSGLPGNPMSDGSGDYAVAIDPHWSGTVTPTMAGFAFTPVDRTYTDVITDQFFQDYTAAEAGGEPNNDPASAQELPLGTTENLIFMEGDNDFYKFYVPPELAGLDLKVNVKVTSPYPDPPPPGWGSDLDFELLDGAERLLGRAISSSDDETLYLHAVASGWYYVHVDYCSTEYAGISGFAQYAVTLETGTPADLGVGVITGRLVNGGGGGLGDVFLRLDFAPDDWSRCRPYMTSNPDGTFAVAFTPDTYTLLFSQGLDGWSAFHTPPNVVGEYYNDTRNYDNAAHLTITAGQTMDLGDIELETGAIITGNVTDMSANPLAYVAVVAYDLNDIALSNEYGYTDAAGNYTVSGVPPGGAKLLFSRGGFAREYYNDQVSLATADTLPTVAGDTLTGINAQLEAAGTITGTVTDNVGNPLGNIRVYAYSVLDGQNPVYSGVTSAADGSYTVYRLRTGDYKLLFATFDVDWTTEWYDNAFSFDGATAVSVISGSATPDIDAQLNPRLTISGTITMSGFPLEGVIMSGLPGDPVTDASGHYNAQVDWDWSGTVTPTRAGYTFMEPSTDYANVTADQVTDYTADTAGFSISGFVTINGHPVQGVVMNGLPDNPVTDADGFYLAAVLPGWSGTVTPAHPGLSFAPPGRDYANVTSSLSYQDFIAADASGEPNDDPGSATELPLGTSEHLIFIEGDNDFYKFYVPPELAGLDLKINVKVTSPYPDPPPEGWGSDLDFELLDGAERLLGRAISSSDDETLYLHAPASGWYYVHVDYCSTEYAGQSGFAQYAVTLEAGTAADFGIGYITGRVTDDGGTGRGDVFLFLDFAPDEWSRCRPYMTTNPDGTFAIAFTPDTYTLLFTRGNDDLSAFHTPPNLVSEFYNDTRNYDNAAHLAITAGQTLDLGDIELQTGAIVTGNVTDGSANPLALVTVQAFDLDANMTSGQEYARTDAAGNYTLSGVPVGGARIRFVRGYYGMEFYNDRPSFGTADNLATVAGETLTGINAQLEERGVISGTVTDGSGAGIAGVYVNVYSVTDGTYRARYGTTDENGDYWISYIKPGDYKVQFDPPGLDFHSEWYDDADDFAGAAVVTVIENTIEAIDAQLEAKFTISGTITTGGQPLEGVVMSGLPGDPVTDAAGAYSGAVDTGWSGTVTPTLAGFSFDPVNRVYAAITESQSGQDYTAVESGGEPNDDPGSATEIPLGTTGDLVFDYAGGDQDFFTFYVPPELAGLDLKVNVRLTAPIPTPQHNDWQSDLDFELLDASERLLGRAISSSDDETLYLHNVASGWYYVHVDFCAAWDDQTVYNQALYEITLETGTPADLGVGVITGRLVNGGGGGLADVFLVLNFAPDDWNRCRPYMTSNPDGTFAVAFTPDTYTLLFSRGSDAWSTFHTPPNVVGEYYNDTRDYNNAALLTITAGQTMDLGDIELETGAIVTGNVTDGSANPLANVAVVAFDLNDIALNTESALTDAAGNYTVNGVPPGGAKLLFSRNGFAREYYNDQASLATADILPTVAGDTLTGINAQLETAGTITGTVTDNGGNPLGNIRVYAYSVLDEQHPVYSGLTKAADGSYIIYRLNTGDYKVFFDTTGREYTAEWYNGAADFAAAAAVSVSAGQNTPDINAQLAPSFTISGTVSSGGAPLQGVVMTGLPGEPATDAFGRYSTRVDRYWSGVVVPVLENYTFTPEQRVYNGVAADQADQDYTADLLPAFTISGTVSLDGTPLEGVLLQGLPGDPVTNGSGQYSAAVYLGWNGTVTPVLDGYTFAPDHRDYTNVTADTPGQDYNAASTAAIPAPERAALIALYNAAGGDTWTNNSGWKTPPLHGDGFALPGTEDTWYGVTLNSGHVQDIDLNHNNLAGTLPAEIGDFPNLTGLNLSGNVLTGSIPVSVSTLAQLSSLRLEQNQLSGAIPTELGSLSNLVILMLGDNQLAGGIPAELGNLTQLILLSLDGNQLSGPIPPQLGNLSNLQELYVYSNQLTGSIPVELGNLSNLQGLGLCWNQLSGTIPVELGNLSNLQELYLFDNQLTGSIPAELGNLANLIYLYLNDNQLSGSIPTALGGLAGLQDLSLGKNLLSGGIPAELGNLSNLRNLDLNHNQLTGTIPDNLQNLSNLETLNLGVNSLSGSLPPWLGSLSHLQSIQLKVNDFSGGLPVELGNLASLEILSLRGNRLSGTLPAELGNLSSLIYLFANYNELTGALPAELGNLSSLQRLALDHNQISGTIPAQLGNLSQMTLIWLDHNQLSGAIPAQIGNLADLEELYLEANQLSGPIPAELGNLGNLTRLNLSANQLSGLIPAALKNLDYLPNLGDIGYNALYATDPDLVNTLNDRFQDWDRTQTVAPENVAATPLSATTVQVTWDAIPYTADNGGYRVSLATTPGGPYSFYNQTADKNAVSLIVSGLTADTPYYFVVQTRTEPHGEQQNTLDSEYSDEATATTLVPETLTLSTPNGGETWQAGTVQAITWSSGGAIPNVRIEYSTDNMASWTDVETGTANDGSYDWTIPAVTSTQCWVRISDAADGTPADTSDAVFTITAESGSTFVNSGVWTTASQGVEGWYVGDFTGDGITDIMNVTERHQKVFESDGTQFIKLGSWIQALIGEYGWFPGDFNGDGMTDLLRYREVDRTQVFLSTGSAFVKDYIWYLVDPGSEGYTIGDFNGDGLDDMLIFDGASNHSNVYLSNGDAFTDPINWFTGNSGADGWYAGDFNGDGRTDIARVNLAAGTEVMLSTGSAFSAGGVWTTALPPSNGWFVGDYNGDGMDDLMRCREDLSGAEVFVSTGTAFFYDGLWCDASLLGADWRVGDFTGDGRDDLLRYDTANVLTEVFVSTPASVPAGATTRDATDLNEGIDLNRPVLTETEETELLRPWLEQIRAGEEGNYFFAIKRAYEKKLGRRVRDTVIFRMLARHLQMQR